MGYDGNDTYTGTIVIIEATGDPFLCSPWHSINFNAGYLRLQSYRPDPQAQRAATSRRPTSTNRNASTEPLQRTTARHSSAKVRSL